MANKASEIVKNLTPTLGEAGAREVARSAIANKLVEDDLGAAPSIDDAVVVEVLKSLTSAQIKAPVPGTTQVNVQKSATAAEPDIDVELAQIKGALEGLSTRLETIVVSINKSFEATGQLLQLLASGVSGVDRHLLEQGAQVVELQKSIQNRRPPTAVISGRQPEANLHDQAAAAANVDKVDEYTQRLQLQSAIQVEIQKSVAAERDKPGSAKARLKELQEAAATMARPVPTAQIAATYRIPLPTQPTT